MSNTNFGSVTSHQKLPLSTIYKFLLISAIAVAIGMFSFTQTANAQTCSDGPGADPDLISYWKADGTPCDSEDGNHGLLRGDTTYTSDRDGNPGSAFLFDGSGDNVGVPDSLNLNPTGAITLAAWVKKGVNGKTQRFLAKQTGTAPYGYTLYYYSNDYLYFSLPLNGAYTQLGIYEPATIDYGWHHIAGTYDGSEMKIFIDGVLAGTKTASGSIGTNTAELRLGVGPLGYEDYLDGSLDDVRIYNRALSLNEIKVLAGAPTTVIDIIYDESGNPVDPDTTTGVTVTPFDEITGTQDVTIASTAPSMKYTVTFTGNPGIEAILRRPSTITETSVKFGRGTAGVTAKVLSMEGVGRIRIKDGNIYREYIPQGVGAKMTLKAEEVGGTFNHNAIFAGTEGWKYSQHVLAGYEVERFYDSSPFVWDAGDTVEFTSVTFPNQYSMRFASKSYTFGPGYGMINQKLGPSALLQETYLPGFYKWDNGSLEYDLTRGEVVEEVGGYTGANYYVQLRPLVTPPNDPAIRSKVSDGDGWEVAGKLVLTTIDELEMVYKNNQGNTRTLEGLFGGLRIGGVDISPGAAARILSSFNPIEDTHVVQVKNIGRGPDVLAKVRFNQDSSNIVEANLAPGMEAELMSRTSAYNGPLDDVVSVKKLYGTKDVIGIMSDVPNKLNATYGMDGEVKVTRHELTKEFSLFNNFGTALFMGLPVATGTTSAKAGALPRELLDITEVSSGALLGPAPTVSAITDGHRANMAAESALSFTSASNANTTVTAVDEVALDITAPVADALAYEARLTAPGYDSKISWVTGEQGQTAAVTIRKDPAVAGAMDVSAKTRSTASDFGAPPINFSNADNVTLTAAPLVPERIPLAWVMPDTGTIWTLREINPDDFLNSTACEWGTSKIMTVRDLLEKGAVRFEGSIIAEELRKAGVNMGSGASSFLNSRGGLELMQRKPDGSYRAFEITPIGNQVLILTLDELANLIKTKYRQFRRSEFYIDILTGDVLCNYGGGVLYRVTDYKIVPYDKARHTRLDEAMGRMKWTGSVQVSTTSERDNVLTLYPGLMQRAAIVAGDDAEGWSVAVSPAEEAGGKIVRERDTLKGLHQFRAVGPMRMQARGGQDQLTWPAEDEERGLLRGERRVDIDGQGQITGFGYTTSAGETAEPRIILTQRERDEATGTFNDWVAEGHPWQLTAGVAQPINVALGLPDPEGNQKLTNMGLADLQITPHPRRIHRRVMPRFGIPPGDYVQIQVVGTPDDKVMQLTTGAANELSWGIDDIAELLPPGLDILEKAERVGKEVILVEPPERAYLQTEASQALDVEADKYIDPAKIGRATFADKYPEGAFSTETVVTEEMVPVGEFPPLERGLRDAFSGALGMDDAKAVAAVDITATTSPVKPVEKLINIEWVNDEPPIPVIFALQGTPVRMIFVPPDSVGTIQTVVGDNNIVVGEYSSVTDDTETSYLLEIPPQQLDLGGTLALYYMNVDLTADSDCDGILDFMEIRFGTNPGDSSLSCDDPTNLEAAKSYPVKKIFDLESSVLVDKSERPFGPVGVVRRPGVCATLTFDHQVYDLKRGLLTYTVPGCFEVRIIADSALTNVGLIATMDLRWFVGMPDVLKIPSTPRVLDFSQYQAYPAENVNKLQFGAMLIINTLTRCQDFWNVSCFRFRHPGTLEEFSIDGAGVRAMPVNRRRITGSELIIDEPAEVIVTDTTEYVPFVYSTADTYWDVVTGFTPPTGCTVDVPEISTTVDGSVNGGTEAAVFTMTCSDAVLASAEGRGQYADSRGLQIAAAGGAPGPAAQASRVAKARHSAQFCDGSDGNCGSMKNLMSNIALSFAAERGSEKGKEEKREHGKPFTSLWDMVKRFLGIDHNQNGTIKDAVIDVARANNISIPEWNVAGTLDSRKLTPSALNALDLSPLLR